MTSRDPPQFRHIKAFFKDARHALGKPSKSFRGDSSNAQQSANNTMSSTDTVEQTLLAPQPTNAIPEIIDSVIEPSRLDRPKLNTKPSWVGPLRPSRAPSPNGRAMMQKVTIKFSSPELLPPVYITTSLSDPEWEPIEMEVTYADDECIFHKDFNAAEGEYQYKFRLGPGDWWVCDESQPMIDDGDGNCNNVLMVSRESTEGAQDGEPTDDSNSTFGTANIVEPVRKAVSWLSPQDSVMNMAALAMNSFGASTTKDEEHDAAHYEPAPLLKHETCYPGQVEHPHDAAILSSPLSSSSRKSSLGDMPWPEPDPDDLSLQEFPTDHASIIKEIERTQQSLPEDTTMDYSNGSPSSRLSLPRVQEEEDEPEILVMIEDSEEDAVDDTSFEDSRDIKAAVMDKLDATGKKRVSKGHLVELGEVFFGIVFAGVVAVVAFVMYSTGMVSHQDSVNDGGATLSD